MITDRVKIHNVKIKIFFLFLFMSCSSINVCWVLLGLMLHPSDCLFQVVCLYTGCFVAEIVFLKFSHAEFPHFFIHVYSNKKMQRIYSMLITSFYLIIAIIIWNKFAVFFWQHIRLNLWIPKEECAHCISTAIS